MEKARSRVFDFSREACRSLPPVVPLSPTPNEASSSSSSPSATMGPIAANESVPDRTDVDSGGAICDDKSVDFNLLEEEFQMQLALAISASDPDVRKDPESAQIDAVKQISLGYAAPVTDVNGWSSWRC